MQRHVSHGIRNVHWASLRLTKVLAKRGRIFVKPEPPPPLRGHYRDCATETRRFRPVRSLNNSNGTSHNGLVEGSIAATCGPTQYNSTVLLCSDPTIHLEKWGKVSFGDHVHPLSSSASSHQATKILGNGFIIAGGFICDCKLRTGDNLLSFRGCNLAGVEDILQFGSESKWEKIFGPQS